MKIRKLILLSLVSFSLLSQIGCSGGGDTASGTGVGNPGKVTVALLADTILPNRSVAPRALTILSADSLPFTITEAYLTMTSISFQHENGDNEKVGPFKFDALKGTSVPEINYDDLPYGEYYGLNFTIELPESTENPDNYSIELKGTFIYENRERDFEIYLNIFGNSSDNFEVENQPAILSKDFYNVFKINMNAGTWLNDIQIKDYLEEGLNQNGDLILDGSSLDLKKLGLKVKLNIFKSEANKLTLEYQ